MLNCMVTVGEEGDRAAKQIPRFDEIRLDLLSTMNKFTIWRSVHIAGHLIWSQLVSRWMHDSRVWIERYLRRGSALSGWR